MAPSKDAHGSSPRASNRRSPGSRTGPAAEFDDEIVNVLQCPVTRQPVRWMTPAEVERRNEAIADGRATQLDGKPVRRPLRRGLVSMDGRFEYRVEDGILHLMKESAISTDAVDESALVDTATMRVRTFYDDVGWQIDDHSGEYTDAVRYEDLRPVSNRYIRECHLRVLRHIDGQGTYFLDAGSGPIQYPEYLLYSAGYRRRICIDVSATALRLAQRKLKEKGVYILGDIANLPIRADSIDGAVSLHTVYHVAKERQPLAFHELHRVLAPWHRAVVVYSWRNSYLNQFLAAPLRLARLLRRVFEGASATRARPRRSTAQLFSEPQTYRWFVNTRWGFQWTVSPWRTLRVDVLRLYVHEWAFGRRILRRLFWLEEKAPRLCAAIGQYGLITIRKDTPQVRVEMSAPGTDALQV